MILIKKTKKYLLFILLLVFFLSCGNQESKQYEEVKEKALIYLKEGYNEDFIVKDIRYIEPSRVYEMMVVPKDDDYAEFYVKTGGANYGDNFVDDYRIIKRAREARTFYKENIAPLFRDVKTRFAGNYYPIEGEYPGHWTFKEFWEKAPDKIVPLIYMYIFQDVFDDEVKKKRFLEDVFKLVTFLKNQGVKKADIQIACFDEEFFKDKDIDHILKISDYFHKGTGEFDTMEYSFKQKYMLMIEDREFEGIETIEDLEKEYYKTIY